MSPGPAALARLAERIAAEGAPLNLRPEWQPGPAGSPAVGYPAGDPRFGELVAAGPPGPAAKVRDREQYAFIVEAIREGYLCHYGESRLLELADPDLALLAGDLLYAIGLNRLSEFGDLESTGILSDLIRIAADLRTAGGADRAATLWLVQIVALSCGKPDRYEQRLKAVAGGDASTLEELFTWAKSTADGAGMGPEFRVAAKAIHLRPSNL